MEHRLSWKRRGISRSRKSRASVALLLVACLVLSLMPAAALAVTITTFSAPSVPFVNAVASYTIDGSTSGNNESPASATFTFPANTDVSGASVLVWETTGGTITTVTASLASVNTATRQVVVAIAFPPDKPGDNYRIRLSGIGNPSSPGSYQYSATVVSNNNKSATGTGSFTLQANTSAVSVGAVTIVPAEEASASALTVPITVGPRGRLASNAAPGGAVTPDTIRVTFPAGFVVPSSPAASSVTVNGTAAAAVSVSGQTVTIRMPAITVANGGTAAISFLSAFGLTNPPFGSYAVDVSTSAETGTGTSPAFSITPLPTKLSVSSPATRPAAATLEQDQVAPVDAFVLSRPQGATTITVNAVRITDGGDAPGVNIAGVQVYRDNGDGTFDAGDVLLNASVATFPSGQDWTTVTFDSPERIAASPRTYWVVYTVAPNPTDGALATSRVTAVTHDAPLFTNAATLGSTFTLKFVVRLSVSMSPDSIDFGEIEPGAPAAQQTISIDVASTSAYVITRTLSGSVSALGLAVVGDAAGSKPSGTGAFEDTVVVDVPWTTPADTSLAATVQYSIVQQ